MTTTITAAGLAVQPTSPDRFGRPCFTVQLSGADAAGRMAVVDEDGLAALQRAGARSLYLLNDGRGREYVSFVRFPEKRAMTVARAIMGDPAGTRVEYKNGDRLDLRRQNLSVREYAGIKGGRAGPTKARA